jgi:hypothetical protein
VRTRHAREIRRAIVTARTRSHFPYRFLPGQGFVPIESPLFMRAFDHAGGNKPPRNPPREPSGVSQPARMVTILPVTRVQNPGRHALAIVRDSEGMQ